VPICPKCHKEIDYLKNYVSGENSYTFSLSEFDGKTISDYDFGEFQTDGKTNDYECPNCSKLLFTDEEKARAFLEGQDELQKIVKEKIEKDKKDGRK